MVKLDNHPEFVELNYNNEVLTISDKYGNHMRLPQFVYDEFEQTGFEDSYLQDQIINHPKLKYKPVKTFNETIYMR